MIGGCDALLTLRGLEALVSVERDLLLNSNLALKSLEGLKVRWSSLLGKGGATPGSSSPSRIGAMAGPSNGIALSQLIFRITPTQSLQRVGGQLFLKGNGVLTDLGDLTSLQSVGSAELVNNGDEQVSVGF